MMALFARDRKKKSKNSRKRVSGVVISDTKDYAFFQRLCFFQRKHSKCCYEDTLENPKMYT